MRTDDLYGFMRAREQIRLNKEAGVPWPWTLDPILQEYKFTNVKRAHDRTTRQLKEEFYDKWQNSSPKVQLLNCAIARYFGTIEFMRAIGWQGVFDPKFLKGIACDRMANGERVFTGAYVITNQGIKAPKQDVVVDIFLKSLWHQSTDIILAASERCSWQDMIEAMQKVPGFGGTGFMAKEVVLDTMLSSFWHEPPVDLNTWCPAGPGARRGLNRLQGKDLKAPMTTAEAVVDMVQLFEQRDQHWPENFVELELHDIQFQLCEFDKYERVRLGQGRPRSKYRRRDG